ncbi:MAG: exo-alpha-sialidase [Verrucomicrobia bacterium]|nr:exo-alpha-sialidase [Verrucomicrobiota bacterium]
MITLTVAGIRLRLVSCGFLVLLLTRVAGAATVPTVEPGKTTAPDGGKGLARNESFSLIVAPWTVENPRHDHSQIFPLRDGRLMLIWCEYYVNRPSGLNRTAYDGPGSRDDAPCRITARISADGGRSWSGRMTLQDNLDANNVKQPNIFRCANGDMLLFFTSWKIAAQERSVHYKRSTDDGETWSEIRQLTAPGGSYILDSGRIFKHTSGRIILPIYWSREIWTDNEKYEAFAYYSDDDGKTWKVSSNRIAMPKRGAMEPTMVERKDGSVFTILRSTVGYLYQAESRDRGQTWSEATPTKLTSPQAEPCLRRIPSTGDLLLIWCNTLPYAMTYPGATTFGRPRNPLASAISRDDGRTWENIKTIEHREGYDTAYPNIYFRDAEAIVTFYQASGSASRDTELLLRVYPVKWFYEPDRR